MAKQNLASMPLGALVRLRDRVGTIIERRTEALKQELRSLGEDYQHVGRIAIYGKKEAERRRRGRKSRRKAARKARGGGTGKSARRPGRKTAKKRKPARR
jgi:hypothetical protein